MPEVQAVESEVMPTLKSLCISLGVTQRTFHRWLRVVGIKPKYKTDAMFSFQEQENLAAFYVATKILGITQNVYAQQVVPISQVPAIPGLEGARSDHLFGLHTYVQESYRVDLSQLLDERIDQSRGIPIPVANVITRLKQEYEYPRAS